MDVFRHVYCVMWKENKSQEASVMKVTKLSPTQTFELQRGNFLPNPDVENAIEEVSVCGNELSTVENHLLL